MKIRSNLKDLWDSIEKEPLHTQRLMYQLMMNKSISEEMPYGAPITKLEGIYLTRYREKFKDVVAHVRELQYNKIFLCEGGMWK